MEEVFKRKIYAKMQEWKRVRNGSTALLIKGARRIGKSTIVEEFAKNEYESYIVIDFANLSKQMREVTSDMSDLNKFFSSIQLLYGVKLTERRSVIVFDEIQKAPLVRQAIKYLVKDGRYDYIETGSLLSIKKNIEDIVIPSEETQLNMYPMDYEEFCWALGRNETMQLIKSSFEEGRPFGDAVNRKLMSDFRLYMIVGGMPKPVSTYLKSNNFTDVDIEKRDILQLYIDDYRKIDPSGKISRMFRSIPAQLAKNQNRYRPSGAIGRAAENTDMERLLEDMEDSLCVNFCYHADNPSVGLSMHKDFDCYKLYVSDTGLFITLAFWDKEITDNIIYKKLLSDKLSADMGYVYENMTAQILKASGNDLFYHTWPTASGKHNYEVDFILSRANKIVPLEVKSSAYTSHTSLDEFCNKYSSQISQPTLVYTKDLRNEGGVRMVPIYLAGWL